MCYEFEWAYEQRRAEEARRELQRTEKERQAKEQKPQEPVPDRSRDVEPVPVIADAEGGFHDAANLWRTVQAFEQAGVAAIHIEDHAFGKHAAVAQKLRPAAEAAARIRAAVEAREDPDFLIVARSDAFWVSGDLEDTIERLALYAEAGADLVFPTLVGPAELAAVRRRVAKPAMIVDMPDRALADHRDAAIVLYYAFSALAQFAALNGAIARL